MSYKSPIEVITEETILRMEDDIVKAVQKYGINVNKTELQKALMYDRKQYTQGFEDGRKCEQEERGHAHWEQGEDGALFCSHCGRPSYDSHDEWVEFNGMKALALVYPYYCGYCGAKMDEVTE